MPRPARRIGLAAHRLHHDAGAAPTCARPAIDDAMTKPAFRPGASGSEALGLAGLLRVAGDAARL